MLNSIRPAIVMLTLFTLLTGIAYPFAITGIAQFALPYQAGGGLLDQKGKVVGSVLVGQNFTSDRYFQGRPSATSAPDPADASKTIDAPYNAANSGGSNLGPSSQKLSDRLKTDAEILRKTGLAGIIPADALTTSASGLDPHISPAFAQTQILRVAKARNISEAKLAELVSKHIEGRTIGVFGEPRINVLLLNLALDATSAS